MNAPVFISHSSKDQKVARTICSALESRGLKCWVASRDVLPGENFMEAIVRTIRSAKVMVLVFTENANNSEEIKKEIVLATQHRLAVIPVRIEDVVPNDALAYQFATMQWIDVFEDWESDIGRLSAYIASLQAAARDTAAPAQPAAAPPAPRAEAGKIEVETGIRILPFWRTLFFSYSNALRDAPTFLRLSWQWFLITAGLDVVTYWLVRPAISGQQKDSIAQFFINFFFASLFGFFASIFVASIVGNRYLRLKLRGGPVETGLKLHTGTASYFGSFIKIFLLFYIPGAVVLGALMVASPGNKLPDAQIGVLSVIALLACVAMLVALFVSSRLLLVLPFKALGREAVTLGDIWHRTRHNNMPILFATVICSLPVWVAVTATSIADAGRNTTLDLLGEAASATAFWFCSWVYTSFLLTAFRRLFAGPEPGA